ncbi:MAG TPA: DUF1501 domain-containing protein [Planctomycetales bacterium]|nr:DUF1501 domain-containing protein [Planctomycetales bacterium]
MITLLGSPRRCCDGVTRRETLKAGALSLLGGAFNLPSLLAMEEKQEACARPGKAKSVILLYLLGGAATQDMWDLKPNAPSGVRSEFRPVATSASGVQICEHLPRMGQWMHRAALIRSVNHKAGCHNCLPSYTGCEELQLDQHPHENQPPSMGSVCEYLNTGHSAFPAYVYMPCWLGWGQVFRRAGPYAGFLGQRYDPLTTECQPYGDANAPPAANGSPRVVRGQPILPDSILGPDLTIDRFDARRGLLRQLDDQMPRVESQLALDNYGRNRRRAFDVLTSSNMRAAFDLKNEDPRLLDRYGRTLFGHSTLIGRRLVEAGVRFVNVTWDLFWDRVQIDYDAWDTHTKNFSILKDNKLPGLDQTYSALMEDLDARGLLDETLVVVMSEMGRTPRVNANGGRDHWTFCYSVLMAGAGIRGGSVYGASDSQAAYVKDAPVSTSDICATIYQCLGIDPDMPVPDRGGRPVPVAQGGRAIREILA